MKKLLSLCLAVVMMVCLLAGITINATEGAGGGGGGGATPSTPAYEYYYFSGGNILSPVSTGTEALSGIQFAYGYAGQADRLYHVNGGNTPSATNYDNYSGLLGLGVVKGAQGASNTVELYVNAAGNYKIWALVPYIDAPRNSLYTSGTTPTLITSGWDISVNGETAQQVANETYNTAANKDTTEYPGNDLYRNQFYWDSITVSLNEGRNLITLTATAEASYIGAMFVTNDITLTSDKFSYIGYYHLWHDIKNEGNAHKSSQIQYFGDGVYHAESDRAGFVNLADHGDRGLPSVTNIAAGNGTNNDSIVVTWDEGDEARIATGSHTPVFVNKDGTEEPFTANVGSGTKTYKYADASGVHHAEVYQDGVKIATVPGGTKTYTATGLNEGSAYNFTIKVVDHYGYEKSAMAPLSTTGEADTTGPQWQAGAEIEVVNASFSSTITWPEATDDRGILGYDIYDADADTLIESVANTERSCTVYLAPGETKTLEVIAKDRSNNPSAPLSAIVTASSGVENYTLRMENFDMPNPGLWARQNISDAMMRARCIQLNNYPSTNWAYGEALVGKSASAEVSAEVYVETAGEYTLFAQMESGRQVKAALNRQKTSGYLSPDAVTTSSGARAYIWAKADRTWNLEAGWNTVTLSTDNGGGIVAAIFLTNSVNVEPSELTYVCRNNTPVIDGKLNIAIYEDTEGAEFADAEIEVAYNSTANEATITWPTATDNGAPSGSTYVTPPSGLQAYRIYVDGTQIGEVDNATTTFVIDEATLGSALVPGETIDITVEALDVFGNESTKSLSYEVSKFVISSFNVKNSTGVATSLADLNDGTVKAELVIKNVSDVPADVRLAIAIYDATGDLLYGDQLDYTVVADGTDYTVPATITGAPLDLTGCTVKAHLWNAGDLSPVSSAWVTIKIQ